MSLIIITHYPFNRWTRLVTYLDLHVIIEEDVSQLQVSVDDSVAVQVVDTFEQLRHVVASLGLCHSLTALVQFQQWLKQERNRFQGKETLTSTHLYIFQNILSIPSNLGSLRWAWKDNGRDRPG